MDIIQWLLDSNEPWTRYRTLVDILDLPESDWRVQAARIEMLSHPKVQGLIQAMTSWPSYPLKRHNDAGHPIYKLSTLADFGLRKDDPAMEAVVTAIMSHQSMEGAFQSLIFIPKAFGGTDKELWTWMLCDAPTLLSALLALGLDRNAKVKQAVNHLVELAEEGGWRCRVAPELGKFRGPGRKSDPCPMANIYVLKALAEVPEMVDSAVVRQGVEMLLGHWQDREVRKYFLFGIGSDFRKLKYPFIWYDILHYAEVLSRFPFVCHDSRFVEVMAAITAQSDEAGRYIPGSIYIAWKDWPFSVKKIPSPWLTFLVLRMQKRIANC